MADTPTPVTGPRNELDERRLAVVLEHVAAENERDVERAQPIFDVLGKSTVHGGPVGNGQFIKLCNQILCGLNLLGVSEAIVFAQRAGLNVETMLKAVSEGNGSALPESDLPCKSFSSSSPCRNGVVAA